jgi:hypothetical protein
MTNSSKTSKDPRNASYWERVAILGDPETSQEDVQWIIEHEEEDDFRKAIASREDASAEQLTWASEHHGHPARRLVIAHPNTPSDVLRKIHKEARQEIASNSYLGIGVSPMQQHYSWAVAIATELRDMAEAKLAERGVEL